MGLGTNVKADVGRRCYQAVFLAFQLAEAHLLTISKRSSL